MTSEGDKLRWVGAIVAFDYGDPEPLGAMIASEAIPDEIRQVIASIVVGSRKPNRRAAAKSKISAAERIQIGATLDAVLVTLNELKHPAITEPYGDQNAVEPRDAIAWINGQIDELYAMASCELNVSRETVENLVRDFRDKMRNWPGV